MRCCLLLVPYARQAAAQAARAAAGEEAERAEGAHAALRASADAFRTELEVS
jgi:hypothetical protein